MPSERQIAANRLNARRSTGPRTPEGRATSSRNALTHGLLAENPVLPDEDPDRFEELRAQLISEYEPVGVIETHLVGQIADKIWRLSRPSRIEAGIIERGRITARVSYLQSQKKLLEQDAHKALENDRFPSLAHPVEPQYSEFRAELEQARMLLSDSTVELGEGFINNASAGDALGKLQRYETGIQRSLHSSIALLKRLQENRIERGTLTLEAEEIVPERPRIRTRPVRADNDDACSG